MPEEEKSRNSYSQEGKKAIEDLGLHPFSKQDLKEIAGRFEDDLKNWSEGRKSSLLMIPTYLTPLESKDLQSGKKSLAISIGGSSVRAGLIETIQGGKVRYVKGKNGSDLVFQKNLPKKKFETAEEFWSNILDQIPAGMLENPPDALALIWAFYTPITKSPKGDIDGKVPADELEKDLSIPGISKSSLGEQLKKALANRIGGHSGAINKIPFVVANDTAAISLAIPNTRISVINGTGYNMSVVAKENQYYNMEACEFSEVKQNRLDSEVDERSGSPGQSLAEKQISGLYLGRQLEIAIEVLKNKGLPIRMKDVAIIDARTLKDFILSDKEKISQLIESTNATEIKDDSLGTLKEISYIIADRSAAALGTYLAATVNAFPNEFPKNETVKVAFDGSVIRENPFYKEWAERYAKELYGRNIQLIDAGQNADLLGAAIAALTLNKT